MKSPRPQTRLLIYLGATALLALALCWVFLPTSTSPPEGNPSTVGQAVPASPSTLASPNSPGQEILDDLLRTYADFSPGAIVHQETHEMADVFLIRTAQVDQPLAQIVYTYNKDLDSGELRLESRSVTAAHLLSVRLKQGVPAIKLRQLAESVGAKVLHYPQDSFSDGMLIFANPTPQKLGVAMMQLRRNSEVTHARQVQLNLHKQHLPPARTHPAA